MLGDAAVGKSSLVSQFMTSEYLHAYDTSIGMYYILSVTVDNSLTPVMQLQVIKLNIL